MGAVFLEFLRLGLTSFGGPVAHLGYFRRTFVERLRWLSEADYADLVALCQFLPGPASSQVGFAIGLRRAGAAGGLAAWLGFTAPSAALMIAAAHGLQHAPPGVLPALVHGFKLVAAAVVAQAVLSMALSLLKTPLRWALALATAGALLATASVWTPLAIAVAGVFGALALRDATAKVSASSTAKAGWSRPLATVIALGALFALLAATPSPLAQMAATMLRTGGLVFGGGHAVLPLMQADVVAHGWLSSDTFLAGYGAAQALPGPLFSIAAYVGAAGGQGVPGALVALVAIFAPGLALVAACLPLWERLKRSPHARGFVAGASAAVVGVLAAALWDPVLTTSIRAPADLAIAALGFAALQWWKAPALLVVVAVALAGALVAA